MLIAAESPVPLCHMMVFPCSSCWAGVDRASVLRRLAQASWPCSAGTDALGSPNAAVRRL